MTDPETVRRWFEQLPRMRKAIRSQRERIFVLRSAAVGTTAAGEGMPSGGDGDRLGHSVETILEAEQRLQELLCEYAELQKEALRRAYALCADEATIRHQRCLVMFYVEGKRYKEITLAIGVAWPSQVSWCLSRGLQELAEIWEGLEV